MEGFQAKKIKRNGTLAYDPLTSFQQDSSSVLERAIEKKDEKLLCRIQGYDLIACKAKFHRKCKKNYLQMPDKWKSKSTESKDEQKNLEDAHSYAFEFVGKEIEEKVIEGNEILHLKDLKDLYVSALSTTEFPNNNFRNEKLKNRIENHPSYSKQISFLSLQSGSSSLSYFLYSKQTPIKHAIELAYTLANTDSKQMEQNT